MESMIGINTCSLSESITRTDPGYFLNKAMNERAGIHTFTKTSLKSDTWINGSIDVTGGIKEPAFINFVSFLVLLFEFLFLLGSFRFSVFRFTLIFAVEFEFLFQVRKS